MSINREFTESFGAIADTDPHTSAQPLNLEGCNVASVTLQWASGTSPVGTFKLQATNHPEPSSDNHWSDLTPSLPISGAAGAGTLTDGVAGYRNLRAHIVLASGDATFTAYYTAKGY
jgi:hypothetical protein